MKKTLLIIVLIANTLFSCGDDETIIDIETKLTSTEWEFVSEYSRVTIDGIEHEASINVNQLVLDQYDYNVSCENGSISKISVDEGYRINYQYFYFNPNRNFILETSTYKKDFNNFETTCESGPIYKESTTIFESNGSWEFDNNLSKLTFSHSDGSNNYNQTSNVKQSGNNLILTFESEEPDNNYSAFVETTIAPKN